MRRYQVEHTTPEDDKPPAPIAKPKRYKVETGIPIPPRGHKEDSRFPWADMNPGQAFFVPLADETNCPNIERLHKRMQTRCANANRRYGPVNGAHYIARKGFKKEKDSSAPDGEHKVPGVWVWRDDAGTGRARKPSEQGSSGTLGRAARSS